MSFLKYTLRRIFTLFPILLGVLFLSFILTRMMEGNPYDFVMPQNPHPGQKEWYEEQVKRLGLDKDPVTQFFIYLKNLFTGNWGESISLSAGKPVWELINIAFPKTVEITLLSVVISSFFGIRTGITSAIHRNKPLDSVIRILALMGVAIPVFWLGILLQYILAYRTEVWIGWSLPGTLYNSPGENPPLITHLRLLDCLLAGRFDLLGDTLLHLILPIFCLTFISVAGITRQARSSMLEVMELDYIRTARAKGCKNHQVIYKHGFRNALIPSITIIGLNVAGLLGGAVLTESTFNLRGMGVLTIQAINARDYFVINACVFVVTLVFVIVNLITDLCYGIVDPRIKY